MPYSNKKVSRNRFVFTLSSFNQHRLYKSCDTHPSKHNCICLCSKYTLFHAFVKHKLNRNQLISHTLSNTLWTTFKILIYNNVMMYVAAANCFYSNDHQQIGIGIRINTNRLLLFVHCNTVSCHVFHVYR